MRHFFTIVLLAAHTLFGNLAFAEYSVIYDGKYRTIKMAPDHLAVFSPNYFNFDNMVQRHSVQTEELAKNKTWQYLLGSVQELAQKGASDRQIADAVNSFVNRKIKYKSDISNYKKNDYWATPLETLTVSSWTDAINGDCEDYAILKYYLLKQVIPLERMFISYVYVEFATDQQAHAVLVVIPKDGEPVVLDNYMPQMLDINDAYYKLFSQSKNEKYDFSFDRKN